MMRNKTKLGVKLHRDGTVSYMVVKSMTFPSLGSVECRRKAENIPETDWADFTDEEKWAIVDHSSKKYRPGAPMGKRAACRYFFEYGQRYCRKLYGRALEEGDIGFSGEGGSRFFLRAPLSMQDFGRTITVWDGYGDGEYLGQWDKKSIRIYVEDWADSFKK